MCSLFLLFSEISIINLFSLSFMKNKFFSAALVCAAATLPAGTFATVVTVSNNSALPGSPGQYTTVQAAHNASLPGDTVLVHGSPTNYNENVTVTKQLTFIGPGYYPQTETGYKATGINFYLANSSTNTKIMGFYSLYVYCTNTAAISGIIIERNHVPGILFNQSGSISGFVIQNNIASSIKWAQTASGLIIRNNIFNNDGNQVPIDGGNSTNSTNIKNNLFVCSVYYAIYGLQNCIIENNIFFGREPVTNTTTVLNCAINNNLTHGVSWTTMPFGSNVGSGNINADPLFIVSPVSFCHDMTTNNSSPTAYNFRLNNASPAKNAGTDGTDIGPTGGASPIYIYPAPYPLTGEPAVPQVQSVTLPVSSVPQGGTLNIQVKARKRN
jgi:hypothetical protein